MTDPYQLEEYIEAHTSAPDAVLQELYRHTYLHEMNPRMLWGRCKASSSNSSVRC